MKILYAKSAYKKPLPDYLTQAIAFFYRRKSELKKQLNNFAKALDHPIASLSEYQLYNDNFIDKVIDGSITPKC